jgi:hypothetical protein
MKPGGNHTLIYEVPTFDVLRLLKWDAKLDEFMTRGRISRTIGEEKELGARTHHGGAKTRL